MFDIKKYRAAGIILLALIAVLVLLFLGKSWGDQISDLKIAKIESELKKSNETIKKLQESEKGQKQAISSQSVEIDTVDMDRVSKLNSVSSAKRNEQNVVSKMKTPMAPSQKAQTQPGNIQAMQLELNSCFEASKNLEIRLVLCQDVRSKQESLIASDISEITLQKDQIVKYEQLVKTNDAIEFELNKKAFLSDQKSQVLEKQLKNQKTVGIIRTGLVAVVSVAIVKLLWR